MTTFEEGLGRIVRAVENFDDGYTYARQEIEAAIEVVLRAERASAIEGSATHRLAGAIRTALNDTHGALAQHDAAIRAEHHDDVIEHLRAMPNVRIASNGSFVSDAHAESSHE